MGGVGVVLKPFFLNYSCSKSEEGAVSTLRQLFNIEVLIHMVTPGTRKSFTLIL